MNRILVQVSLGNVGLNKVIFRQTSQCFQYAIIKVNFQERNVLGWPKSPLHFFNTMAIVALSCLLTSFKTVFVRLHCDSCHISVH